MRDGYVSPLGGRYASGEMQYIFSDERKFRMWRRLWLTLAEQEKRLGLAITDEQLDEMREHLDDIDFARADEYEKRTRHDVMAHVLAFGDACPGARGIIHLGATSCYVKDNEEMTAARDALDLIERRLADVIAALCRFAESTKDIPTLGYTHLQPAQPTTVGKRAALWASGFLGDLLDVRYVKDSLEPLGCKGTTGTGASFLELFDGDRDRVFALDDAVAKSMGFKKSCDVAGQTYSRKQDYRVLSALSSCAQSAYKFAADMRILQGLKELEEPFGRQQIGSSAMPYKRNPMRCERICSLARYVINDAQNAAFTAADQWLERTLDDSANRRMSISEAFLALDGVLLLCRETAQGIVVNGAVIDAALKRELPFMASENILMEAVKRGGDRQTLHEKLRVLSQRAGERIKREGLDGQLLESVAADADFGLTREEIDGLCAGDRLCGTAAEQTERFVEKARRTLYELGLSPEEQKEKSL